MLNPFIFRLDNKFFLSLDVSDNKIWVVPFVMYILSTLLLLNTCIPIHKFIPNKIIIPTLHMCGSFSISILVRTFFGLLLITAAKFGKNSCRRIRNEMIWVAYEWIIMIWWSFVCRFNSIKSKKKGEIYECMRW